MVKRGLAAVVIGSGFFAAIFTLAQNTAIAPPEHFVADRSHLPPALQHVPLKNLSSGALMLLDRGGDLVRPSAAAQLRTVTPNIAAEANIIALDPRVGDNIRLGDDPPALPSGMRAQAEPHIVRSPANPNFLVGTFKKAGLPTAERSIAGTRSAPMAARTGPGRSSRT